MTTAKKIEQELRKSQFIKILSDVGNVSVAAGAVGLSLSSVYHFREVDKKFARKWEGALEMAGDSITAKAMRRAIDGIKKEVWHRGEVIGVDVEYSDSLLSALIKFSNEKKLMAMDTDAQIKKINRMFSKHGRGC